MKALHQKSLLDARSNEFLDTLDKATTRATNEYALKAFNAFRVFGCPATLKWKQIEFDVLVKFDLWMKKQGYKELSRRTYYACVLEFLRYGVDKEWLPPKFSLDRAIYRGKKAHDGSSYPIPEIPPALPRVIAYYDEMPLPEGDDYKARWTRLGILRARAIVHVLYASLGRVSEVASLKRKAVQDGKRKVVKIKGKRDKERFLYMTPESQAAIAAYLLERNDLSEPLFIRHNKGYGQPITRQMLWKTVHTAGLACGIQVSPHDFRHFRASQMLNEGARIEAIQEILGHESIETTRRVYAHYSKPAVRNIFERTTLSPTQALARIAESEDE